MRGLGTGGIWSLFDVFDIDADVYLYNKCILCIWVLSDMDSPSSSSFALDSCLNQVAGGSTLSITVSLYTLHVNNTKDSSSFKQLLRSYGSG